MAINVSHMVQEIAMELLSNAGFSVSLADDGDVAVETLRTAAPDQFDLVLMDIQMPKLDGSRYGFPKKKIPPTQYRRRILSGETDGKMIGCVAGR